MSKLELSSDDLRAVATALYTETPRIPTTSPLAMNAVSANDVTAAANNFNLWFTYTGMVARAQLTAVADSIVDAAVVLEQAEAQIAANAVSP